MCVDLLNFISETGGWALDDAERCRLLDALPHLLAEHPTSEAPERAWARALRYREADWPSVRERFGKVLGRHGEPWFLECIQTAVLEAEARSRSAAERGRKGGLESVKRRSSAAQAQLEPSSSAAQAESVATVVGVGSDVSEYALVARDGKVWVADAVTLAGYRRAYPGVDIAQQFARMRVWIDANPSKAKSLRGLPRFASSWLSRATPSPAPSSGGADALWSMAPRTGGGNG